jgi:alpha-L-rhamnosidase
VRLTPPAGAQGEVTVHFGEALDAGRVDRTPPGTVRYGITTIELGSASSLVAAPPAEVRNTWDPTTDFRHEAMRMLAEPPPPAILTPADWGVVLPYRWLEIEGWPGELRPEHLTRQSVFASTWDDSAADFRSSDPTLNRIWELCRYSIKATTFAGVYVDGDRERIPYEADAYLNQLSHYTTDHDVQMARDTLDHLMIHGTWPTEWAPHLVLMAHADWMRTGDTSWLSNRFDDLKTKLLTDRAGPDGLIRSDEKQQTKNDIVDWPKGERDGYVFTAINTVINALHLHTLRLMSEMANALGNNAESAHFSQLHESTLAAFQALLFDPTRGIYVDGIGTDHAS